MKEINSLRQALQSYRAALAELGKLDKLKADLEAEARNLAQGLKTVPSEALIVPQDGAHGFDKATFSRLQNAGHIRDKLQLFPGIRAKVAAEVERLTAELIGHSGAARLLDKACLDTARVQVGELTRKLTADMGSSVFGGDPRRTKLGIAAIIEHSEATRWYLWFRDYMPPSDPAAAGETALLMAERFLRGDPRSAAEVERAPSKQSESSISVKPGLGTLA